MALDLQEGVVVLADLGDLVVCQVLLVADDGVDRGRQRAEHELVDAVHGVSPSVGA